MAHHPGAGDDESLPEDNGSVPSAPVRSSPILGLVGLVLVGIDLLFVIVGFLLPPVIVVSGWSGWSTSDSSRQLVADTLSRFSAGQLLLGIAIRATGLAGWIVGLVATIKNRGRGFGIAAVVIGAALLLLEASSGFGLLILMAMG